MKKGRKILILGGGIMQLPAVRIAKRKGWHVTVAAREVSREVGALADRSELIDLQDHETLIRMARRLKEGEGLDGVFTSGTDFSTAVARIAERLSLPGIPYAAALNATDKARMRRVLRSRGVPCPRFFTLERSEQASSGLDKSLLDFPLVVKPVDNMGARAVRRVDSREELRAAIEQAWEASRSGEAIVEEYMEGPELSLDAVVAGEIIHICGVADRHICFPPHFVEMGHTMPSALAPELLEEAAAVFKWGILALGLEGGAAKGDIKVTSAGAKVGEIAARLSGGYMSGWTFPLSSGVEVTEAALNLAMGMPVGDLTPRWQAVSAERAFISIPGKVRTILGIEEARSLPGVQELFLRTSPGAAVSFPLDNLGKCGNVISRAEGRVEAVTRAEEAIQRILIRLEPNREETARFLFQESGTHDSPSAFPLEARELENRLQGIVEFEGWTAFRAGGGGADRIAILEAPTMQALNLKDWHGLSLRGALDKVRALTGSRMRAGVGGDCLALGRVFWRALIRGGVQGAVFLIDSILESPEALHRFTGERQRP